MLDSFTSPTIDDIEFDNDGTYMWDCWNIELCCKYNKSGVNNHGCLKGSSYIRCSRDEKILLHDKLLFKSLNKKKR
ncbi:MAG: hypothetical protein E7234_06120 [Lachnospiraceae bacterium]|nr:hypothetical protein [Lachnospiraceae bacterium]